MTVKKIVLVLCVFCFFPSFQSADAAGFEEITAPETKLMMEEDSSVILVNVLSALEYELQRIPGSISIPIDHLKGSTLLPKDKDTPIIFYCMGPR